MDANAAGAPNPPPLGQEELLLGFGQLFQQFNTTQAQQAQILQTIMQNTTPPGVLAAAPGPSNPKPQKLPTQDGRSSKGLVNWLDLAESHIAALGMPTGAPRTVNYVASSFTGPLSDWWVAALRKSEDKVAAGFASFGELRAELLSAYRITDPVDDARHALSRLTQTGSIEAYVRETVSLNSMLPNRDEGDKIQLFAAGLKKMEKTEVLQRKPATLKDAISIATLTASLYDRAHRAGDRHDGPPGFHGHRNAAGPAPMDLGVVTAPPRPPARPLTRVNTNTTKEQRDQMRREGKCFVCRATDHIAPHCPHRQPAAANPADRRRAGN